jgi:hypothetical protein
MPFMNIDNGLFKYAVSTAEMYSPASSNQMLLRSKACRDVREDHCDVLEHNIQCFA